MQTRSRATSAASSNEPPRQPRVGRRSRRQAKTQSPPEAPSEDYTDPDGNVLTLRGSLTVGSRKAYAQALGGNPLSLEDARQRAFELLFERLAVRWVIAGVASKSQKELLARLRVASAEERDWVRQSLRRHCDEHFPDVQAP
jgi:hypothetical protein